MSAFPNDEKKTFTIEVPVSSWRWLRALAKENRVRAEDMLARAAECMADAAGRKPGSPEADVGRRLLYSGGYNGDISPQEIDRLRREDEAEKLGLWGGAMTKTSNDMGVYAIENLVNGKYYIGSAIDVACVGATPCALALTSRSP